MSENRRQILEMLSQGKINADEAERLIAAVERPAQNQANSSSSAAVSNKPSPKYLRVVVEENGAQGPNTVNVRVPLQLLRAGVKLASVLPVSARSPVNTALREQGIEIDLSQLKPENLEELIEHLNDLTVDVNEGGRNKVRVFCE